MNLKTNKNDYSNRFFASLLGYDEDEFSEKGFESIMDGIHPDDLDYLKELLTKASENKGGQTSYIIDYRQKTKRGQYRWLRDHIRFLFDTEGQPEAVIGSSHQIDEYKDSERARIESEKRYKELLELLPEMVYELDLKGNIVYANKIALTKFGFSEQDLMRGVHAYDTVVPEQRDYVRQNFEKALRNESNSPSEYLAIRSDGSTFPLLNYSSPIIRDGKPVGIRGIMIDITMIKEAQKALEESEQKYKLLVELAPEIIYSIDHEGKIVWLNNVFEKISGFKKEEYTGAHFTELIHERDLELALEKHQSIQRGEKPDNFELLMKTKGGVYKPFLFHINPFKQKDGHWGTLGIAHNIENQKRYEHELKLAKEKAEESDRLKSAFLANMTHEIRTPMNGILGFAKLLEDEDLTPEEKNEYLDIINSSGNHLLALINDIIDISRIEAGQMSIKKNEFRPNEMVRYLVTFFKSDKNIRENKEIEIRQDTDPGNDALLICGDELKIKQILTNLTGNAIKFTPAGYVEIGYVIEKENHIRFFVKDTGIGLDKEEKNLIFNRFRQVESAHNRKYSGAGLGLSISKGLVELMGGQISVLSEKGKGSEFSFTLPMETACSHGNDMAKGEKEKSDKGCWLHKTALVVEDDYLSFRYIERALHSTDIKLIHAKNGEEAIEKIEAVPEINIVIMDIHLPVLNGIEATRRIKQLRPTIPVIVQTANVTDSNKKECQEAGSSAFLLKPLDKKELIENMKKYLD